MQKSIEIAIRGGYGLFNFGDDALIYTLYNFLVEEKSIEAEQIFLICRKEDYLYRLMENVNVIDYNRLPKDIEINHLIYGGGTQFYSFDPIKESKFKKFLNHPKRTFTNALTKTINFFLENRFLENKFDIINNVNFHHLLGVGLGPFSKNDDSIENKTRELFQSAKFVSVRDEFAENKCMNWGVGKYMKAPDICYAMEVDKPINNSKNIKHIAIIVRDWNHSVEGKEYYNSIINVVEKLRKLGYLVTYVSYDMFSDLNWLKFIKENNEKALQWNPNNDNINDFIAKHYNFDLVITARFHGAVFASLIGKPFITIGIEPKLEMISSLYSGASHCWKMPFEEQSVLSLVNEISSSYTTYVEKVEEHTLVNKENARFQFEALYSQIKQL